jgi:hypothetical protein
MSITITPKGMHSDQVWHWAVPRNQDEEYGEWVVSWLRDRSITRNQAITAMTIAELVTAGHGDRDENRRQIDQFAAELGLTGTDAVTRVVGTVEDSGGEQ